MTDRNSPTAHLLLVDCVDRPGLIHEITGAIGRHGANILTNDEFVDQDTHRFFMRTEFVDAKGPGALVAEVEGMLTPPATVRLGRVGGRRLVIFATREPHCLGELLLRHEAGELDADIAAVVSNHPSLEPLVGRFGIPFHHVPTSDDDHPRDRAEHEAAVQAVVEPYAPDYLVLAKYMRVLSPAFVAAYPRRILNIHHSFLPAFAGSNPYRQAFLRGVKIIGATAHYVTDALDEGPIIAQAVVPVDHSYRPEAMARAGRDVEKIVLAKALKLVLEERVFLNGGRTIVFD